MSGFFWAYKVGVQTHKIEDDALVIAAMQLSGSDIKTLITFAINIMTELIMSVASGENSTNV